MTAIYDSPRETVENFHLPEKDKSEMVSSAHTTKVMILIHLTQEYICTRFPPGLNLAAGFVDQDVEFIEVCPTDLAPRLTVL
jgi:hypothetical protein